jgi:hypothetical protein
MTDNCQRAPRDIHEDLRQREAETSDEALEGSETADV